MALDALLGIPRTAAHPPSEYDTLLVRVIVSGDRLSPIGRTVRGSVRIGNPFRFYTMGLTSSYMSRRWATEE